MRGEQGQRLGRVVRKGGREVGQLNPVEIQGYFVPYPGWITLISRDGPGMAQHIPGMVQGWHSTYQGWSRDGTAHNIPPLPSVRTSTDTRYPASLGMAQHKNGYTRDTPGIPFVKTSGP
jgi:hypothetical protein